MGKKKKVINVDELQMFDPTPYTLVDDKHKFEPKATTKEERNNKIRTMVRRSDEETSFLAANLQMSNLDKDKRRVYDLLTIYKDGLTDYEISEKLSMLRTTAGKRRLDVMKDLEKANDTTKGKIIKTDLRRKTSSKATAIVWRLIIEKGK